MCARNSEASRISRSDWPRKRTSPAVGSSSAPSICSSVDFPHPLGPATATDSPSPIVMLIPRNAFTRPPSKERRKSRVSINTARDSSGMERNEMPVEETLHDSIELMRLLKARRMAALIDELEFGERQALFEFMRHARRRDVIVRSPHQQNRHADFVEKRAQVIAFRRSRHPHQRRDPPPATQRHVQRHVTAEGI